MPGIMMRIPYLVPYIKANIAMREKYNKVMIQWEKAHPNWSER